MQTSIASLAPLAPTWNGAQNGVSIAAPQPLSSQSNSSGSFLPAFWDKITSVAGQSGDIAKQAGQWVGQQLASVPGDIIGTGAGGANVILDKMTGDSLAAQTQELNTRLDSIIGSYKSGQLDKKGYAHALGQWNQDNQNVSAQLSAFQSKTNIDQQNFTKSAIGTEVILVSLMTGGVGAGLSAPEMVAANSEAAATLTSAAGLTQAAATISQLAESEAAWSAVSPLAQTAMRVATSQVLQAAGASATAGQITRAVAADLLLKFPLYYNAMSGTGQQIYTELNQNKYGDAVSTLAFNAVLLFSGGPIGWGLKQVKGIYTDAMVASSLQPGSILDEFSSRIANGDRLALGKIAQEQIQQGHSADVKAMIVGLESNLKAENGNAASAVNRIVDHLSNYLGWGDLTKNMTHQQAWDNMVNYWKHSVGLQDLKAQGKIEGMAANDTRAVVPGRFATQDKNGIAEAVTKGDLSLSTGNLEAGIQTPADRQAAFEAHIAANPNAAYANNPNVYKQVSHLIATIKDPQELHTAINNIKTQIGLSGIPKEYAAQMAKDGYIAIVPTSHNLPVIPFSETTGKLATNAAEGSFFTRAAQPVPVLKSIGTFLTWAGLSPAAAGQRVQDIFTQNFNAAAEKFGFLSKDTSAGKQELLSEIYNYMKAPTGGVKVFGHYMPYSDIRQLTVGDIMRATGLARHDAQIVGDAIMQAHLDVPHQITGIGDKLLSATYRAVPLTAKVYGRVQAVGRFAWNPVFNQARLPIKEEILAQMQTGGKFPTIAGTNRFMSIFFPGQYKELNAIIANPDFKSLVGGGLGGEAEAATSGVGDFAHSELPPHTTLLPIAGLVRHMAANAGLDTATYMQQFPQQVQDATQALLHYDRGNSFLNSPLAKTLNIAFFPFRFNVKVAGYMANFVAKQPPAIQYAVIKGMMNAQSYLKSPQGQAWYATHSDAIDLFKYFSPLETLSTFQNILSQPGSISSYGELGGLPFGWIPQMTDAVGMTHFGQAYVSPKTGAIAKNYVPTSAYGALNAAIQDLVGSLFTYPGASAGLPSKGSIDRTIANNLLPYSSKEFTAVANPNVTPQDQQFSQIAQQANGAQAPGAQPQAATPQSSNAITVPKTPTSINTPLPKSTGAGKMKKGQFKPYLLPGQSQRGQL